MYQGGSVEWWMREKAFQISIADPHLTAQVVHRFNFKTPLTIAVEGKSATLTSLVVSFTPKVQWLAETVQLDARSAIYDYVRGRTVLTPGNNSFTIKGIDLNRAKPIPTPSPIPDFRTVGPGVVEAFLVDLIGSMPPGNLAAAKLDGLIRDGDLPPVAFR